MEMYFYLMAPFVAASTTRGSPDTDATTISANVEVRTRGELPTTNANSLTLGLSKYRIRIYEYIYFR